MRKYPILLAVIFQLSLFNFNTTAAVSVPTWTSFNVKDDHDRLNAKNFGAKGDGKHNDAPALQKAIDEAAKTHKTLLIPAGTYFLPAKSTLNITSGVTIEGDGKELTKLVTESVTDTLYPTLISIAGANITLRGLAMSGGRPIAEDQKSDQLAGRYTVINISFDIAPSSNILIDKCQITDAYGRGLLYKGNHITIQDSEFFRLGRYNIDFKPIDGAISNFGRSECSDIRIIHNAFKFVGTHAVSSYKVNRLTIEDNYLSQISGIGLGHQQCQNTTLKGNRIEYTGDNGIDVQRCQQTLITANYFYAAGNKNAGDAGSAAAIFYGDDYAQGLAVNAVISNNFIRGDFNFKPDNIKGHSQSCGIYIIDSFHIKVLQNTISGIGDKESPRKIIGIEDGNGIMIVNSKKGQSRDVLVDGNSVTSTKNNGIFVNGQSRDLKVVNNNITAAGGHGIYFSSVATNLFGIIKDNTITDGLNWFNKTVAADIFIEAKNGWLTHLNISSNQLRNNQRATEKNMNDTVQTTHGLYFTGQGFAKFNNLIVTDNQISGHKEDEIGFSDKVLPYSIFADRPSPLTGFRNNFSGSTDDEPQSIIPGYHQKSKPWIITESYAFTVPAYGNYSKGSVINNLSNPAERWIAQNSGFAAQTPWMSNVKVTKGKTVYVGDQVWRCIKSGTTGATAFNGAAKTAVDGSVNWEAMGKRVMFVK
jgi:hypothetical protein